MPGIFAARLDIDHDPAAGTKLADPIDGSGVLLVGMVTAYFDAIRIRYEPGLFPEGAPGLEIWSQLVFDGIVGKRELVIELAEPMHFGAAITCRLCNLFRCLERKHRIDDP